MRSAMSMPMRKKSPDVLEALMSEPMDDEEMMPAEDDDSDTAVIAIEDEDDAAPEAAPEEGTPQATIEALRKGLDELEMMFSQ
jgi:hypothetical protein